MVKTIQAFWGTSIRRQLIISIALIHAVMMSFFVFDLVDKERKFLNTQHKTKTEGIAKSLALNATPWVLANDYIGLQEVIAAIQHYPNIEYAMILSPQGQVLAHSEKKYIGKYLSDQKSIEFLKGEMKNRSVFENNLILDFVVPIYREKQIIGWSRIALNKKDINQGLHSVTYDGLIYTLTAILVGAMLAYFIGAGLTTSIYRIIDTVKRTKAGEGDARSKLNRKDEIGQLSLEFDKMLNRLSSQHRFINSIMDSIPDLIFFKEYKEQDGRYLGCNNAFTKFVGKEKKDIIGKNDYELFDKKIAEFFRKKDFEMLKMGTTLQNEEEVQFPDGSMVILDTKKTILYDDEGEVLGVLGISRDITEKQKIHNELDNKNKLLFEQAKLASMGEMIANIAHQWRQPLSVISMIASSFKLNKQLGIEDDIDQERLLIDMEKIISNAQYLSRTIDDFRNFIRGNSKAEKFSLKNDTKIFLQLVDSTIKNNDIQVILNLEESADVKGYPNELIQCFINIFNNAKDALKELDIEERYLFITQKVTDKAVQIIFRDNAGGIKEDILPRIFEPYFTTKHQSQGTGIGLHMTYNLITQGMRGEIKASNKEFEFKGKKYKGAEFIISLPKE